jgi:tetratricopeptide (TPR) repeat protein
VIRESACRRAAPRLSAALLAALTLLLPGLARAQSEKDVETARAVFVEASKLAEQGRFADARDRYLLSLRLRRAAITFYSLGVVDKELGRLAEARESFRDFLAEPSAPATREYEEPARKALAEIEIKLAAEHPGESTSLYGPVDPSAAPGRTLPFVLLGAGGAVFAAGLVTGIVGLSEARNATTSTGPDADAARTKALVGDVLGGVGLAAMGAGVIVLLLQKSHAPAKASSVIPWIGGTSAGVTVRF